MKKEIQGFTFEERKTQRGFTLVEILVVVGILGIIAVVASTIFFTTLRSAGKTKVLTTVKQNGDYALTVMERLIRDSQEVSSSCTSGMTSITVKRFDGSEITFSCDLTPDRSLIASSSGQRLTSSDVKVDKCSFDCSCPAAYADCTSQGTKFYPKTVTIKFTLSQVATTVRPEEEATIDFQTTVSTRNY